MPSVLPDVQIPSRHPYAPSGSGPEWVPAATPGSRQPGPSECLQPTAPVYQRTAAEQARLSRVVL